MPSTKRGACKLCSEEKELRNSHVFPRSYTKYLKRGNGQLVKVLVDEKTKPSKSNSDAKERLLCHKCEQFLSKYYENYGTRLFKNKKTIEELPTAIIYNNFQYKKFYLYLISILWRASLSTLENYAMVNLPQSINDLLRKSITHQKIELNAGMRVDDFIKIGVLKIFDKTGKIPENTISKIFLNINIEVTKNYHDGILYYFMIDGHLVLYYLYPAKSVKDAKSMQIIGQLENGPSIIVPKIDFGEIKQIHESFAAVQRKFKEYGIL